MIPDHASNWRLKRVGNKIVYMKGLFKWNLRVETFLRYPGKNMVGERRFELDQGKAAKD